MGGGGGGGKVRMGMLPTQYHSHCESQWVLWCLLLVCVFFSSVFSPPGLIFQEFQSQFV